MRISVVEKTHQKAQKLSNLMTNEKSKNLPEASDKKASTSSGQGGFMKIENMHLHANDMHALARIAETDVKLAEKIVEQRENEDKRYNASYRFGIVASVILVGLVLISLSLVLINLGVVASFGMILGVFVIALLIRVIITGEWSETTWFGRAVRLIAKALGSGVVSDASDTASDEKES